MAKIILYPPYGTREDAKSIKFEISGLQSKDFLLEAEDVTHGKMALIDSVEVIGKNGCMGMIHLDIPEDSSHSIISIFVYIKDKIGISRYKTTQICPLLFSIKEDISESSTDKVSVSPVFVGPEDTCSIHVLSKPNSKISLSINKKYFSVLTDSKGEGSIHFKTKEVLEKTKSSSVQKIPVYIYNLDKNYTQRLFSGSYLNILPTSIALHASIDPRCDVTDPLYVVPGTWTTPSECIGDPVEPDVDPVDPNIPPIDIPSSCEESSSSVSIHDDACKIYGSSVTLLNNGTVLYSYISPDNNYSNSDDDRFNVNRVFIKSDSSSIDVQIIANQDVAIEPKEPSDRFRIFVQQDLWQSLYSVDDPSSADVYVVFFSRSTGFQRVKIVDRIVGDTGNEYILIGEAGETSVAISSWIFCVNAVFYHSLESPSMYVNDDALPYIQDSNDDYLQIVNVCVSSNIYYIGEEEESYVYIIAEAVCNKKNQLFFYSLSIGKSQTYISKSFGWKQLTYDGNNKNPKAKMDKNNNLHIVWESDRSGKYQLYYGVMGLSCLSIAGSALSSFVDKYSEFLSKEDKPFSYINSPIMEEISSSEYANIPEVDTNHLIIDHWKGETTNGGVVVSTPTLNYLDDLSITANALDQSAIAIASMPINPDLEDPSTEVPYSQYNYQITFDLQAIVNQSSDLVSDGIYYGRVIEDKEIDRIYEDWKSDYTVEIDHDLKNQPVYVRNNNKFILGRKNNVFDRVVPVIGSYKYHDINNPSWETFQVKILEESNNLKDFVIGMMFEKTYFYANNIQTLSENPSEDYIPTFEECIYTGRAKFVIFIKTEKEMNDDRENYIIVKEFPEAFDATELKNYKIILNYKDIQSDEVENILYTQYKEYDNKFLGSITLLINNVPRFSQSFISTLYSDYNYFDIGFGIPYGGCITADKMYSSKLNMFDNTSSNLLFTNISISSPTMDYNPDILSVPPLLRNNSKFVVRKIEDPTSYPAILYSNPSVYDVDLLTLKFQDKEEILYYLQQSGTNGQSFSDSISSVGVDRISIEFNPGSVADRMVITTLYGHEIFNSGYITSSGSHAHFDVDLSFIDSIQVRVDPGVASNWDFTIYFKKVNVSNSFVQIPITIEGINQSPDIEVGLCSDVHVVWQSNRDMFWNIYYSNTSDYLHPFRYDTQITNTNSNSLKPSISVCRNGKRMIVWHDNRDGNYDIYSARSISGYSCDDDKCEKKMLQTYNDKITECVLSVNFDVSTEGIYKFSFEFYSDKDLLSLYKTITMDDNLDRWFLDGSSIENIVSYNSDGDLSGVSLSSNITVSISYVPDKDDEIFDKVLYAKLIYSIT